MRKMDDDKPPSQIQFNKRIGNEHRDTDRSIESLCSLLIRSRQMGIWPLRATCLCLNKQLPIKGLVVAHKI